MHALIPRRLVALVSALALSLCSFSAVVVDQAHAIPPGTVDPAEPTDG